jgi:anhydro-N-acetylmuramic acid kinase
MKNTYRILGLMSGTSLDGLDMACCDFRWIGGRWEYQVGAAETRGYTPAWKERLANLEKGTALEFVTADVEYGHLLGELSREFLERHHLQPDFIASHGHTIFHQPSKRFTSQIGSGAAIAAETRIPVVCDFRSADVALGGQGAPLVPVGDELLFPAYRYCLNLGGFANVSFRQSGRQIAFDICPANIMLNALAAKTGMEYDHNGILASRGMVITPLLDQLNALPYYRTPPPKSLGKEWTLDHVWPLLHQSGAEMADLLATWCEHMAIQISQACSGADAQEESDPAPAGKILVTGGGALNLFLMERLKARMEPRIVIPDPAVINYKEALIFAFLGLLRWRGEPNCLSSVTGAAFSHSGGAIYQVGGS